MIGAGTFAKRCAYFFDEAPQYSLVAFAVDPAHLHASEYLGRPLISQQALDTAYPAATHAAFVAVGYSDQNRGRSRLADALTARGYSLATYQHPTARIHASTIGPGSFVADGTSVGPFSTVGRGCVLSVGCILSHDCQLGDDCYVSSGAIISGGCQIGARGFIGVGARIRDGITIAPETTIGAGAVVIRDIDEPGTYVGVPARRLP